MEEMSLRRLCIFTNNTSDAKIKLSKTDVHNWIKTVPCTKVFLELKADDALNEHERSLVEMFYEKEILLNKIVNITMKMRETREKLDPSTYIKPPLTEAEQDIAAFKADMAHLEELEKKKIKKKMKEVKETIDKRTPKPIKEEVSEVVVEEVFIIEEVDFELTDKEECDKVTEESEEEPDMWGE